MGPAAGPERPQSAAAHHSENTDDFSGFLDGPVKGMTSREERAVPQLGPWEFHESTRLPDKLGPDSEPTEPCRELAGKMLMAEPLDRWDGAERVRFDSSTNRSGHHK